MKRLPGWRTRLNDCLEDMRRRPFQWGEHDCALGLAAPCVAAMTGIDLGAEWRGRYATADEARAVLAAAGHDDIGGLLASLFEEVPPAFAGHGDLATLPGENEGLSIGVVTGAAVTVLGARGLSQTSRLNILRAFRV
ncbi:MAG: hypothetical protein JO256_08190 [Alphaproteobacteria bacterium]|nr:hypothetical protein [Alphaproteobacteria bacterium]